MKLSPKEKESLIVALSTIEEETSCGCFKYHSEEFPTLKKMPMTGLYECTEKADKACNFAVPFGTRYFCQCDVLQKLWDRLHPDHNLDLN